MNNLLKKRLVERNPKILLRRDDPVRDDFSFRVQERVGLFYRVWPTTARDVAYLRALQKGYDYFTPAEGNGLIISAHSIPAQ
jgi:hypothetical protein|tara:strand:+ start:1467 stop:1712 length:246 start_codon:yes stop_codon:yes gene_type:complete